MKRHACNVIGTCSKGEMESSCASALPVREPENTEAARERETNASGPLAAPEVAGKRETNAPYPMETAKSMGARETNVQKETFAAVRRDGEPLTSAAKKRRQKEAAADEHQAAGEGAAPFTCERGNRTRATVGHRPRTPATRRGRRGSAVANCCKSRPRQGRTRQFGIRR